MFRALAMLRVVVLVWAVALNVVRDNFDHPTLGWICVGVMVVTTGAAIVVYDAPQRRVPAVLLADLAIAVGLLLATPLVKGEWFQATIPGYWIVGALLAWGIRYGLAGGTAAGVLLAGTDLLSRAEIAQKDWGNVFLILLGGTMLGFVCESLKTMAAERDLAQREAAAAAERVRLARVVHDGVLQVLALVQRRGAEIGGDASELGRLAGAQEQALRSLIRAQDTLSAAPAERSGASLDVAAALDRFAARGPVQVALPPGAVPLAAAVADELVAVVGACLDNVAVHVGPDAPAWVLLEDLGDEVEVSVRDEGPGIPVGRLAEAEAEGRLGVAESIRGRIRDLGGTATLDTGPHGTEWTLTVPRSSKVGPTK